MEVGGQEQSPFLSRNFAIKFLRLLRGSLRALNSQKKSFLDVFYYLFLLTISYSLDIICEDKKLASYLAKAFKYMIYFCKCTLDMRKLCF
jgi:hypothetical protein